MIEINYFVREKYNGSNYGMHLFGDLVISLNNVSVNLRCVYINQTLNDLRQLLLDFKNNIIVEDVDISIEEKLIISISESGGDDIVVEINKFIKMNFNYKEILKSVCLALEQSSKDNEQSC